ncbi:MAG: hypothetical protein AB7F89_03360 [Pirellulaceae bacterium]
MSRFLSLSAVAILCAAMSPSLPAGDYYGGFYGHGFPWFGYGNQGPAAYALGNIPAPPYFALHPPVYYSHPVARPYGHSPFACPCGGHVQAPRPARRIVANPFIELKPAEPAKPAGQVAKVPVRIVNPFFEGTARSEVELVQQ